MTTVTKNRIFFKWPKLLYFKPEYAQNNRRRRQTKPDGKSSHGHWPGELKKGLCNNPVLMAKRSNKIKYISECSQICLKEKVKTTSSVDVVENCMHTIL
jgi:hypothetical protein